MSQPSSNLSPSQMKMAKYLLKRAIDYQQECSKCTISDELIERATPVLWRGENVPGNIVTVGTNPSSKEFLNQDNELLAVAKARFFIREPHVSLEEYKEDDQQLEKTIDYYRTYFARNTAYRSWFGREGGGKLEAFINGMGGSFYNSNEYTPVIHMDLFPIPTRKQMGRIKLKEELLNSDFVSNSLVDLLAFLKPSLIIVLGKEHCERIVHSQNETYLGDVKFPRDFPDAAYQVGYYSTNKIPLLGLHFKPSEQFIGLGSKRDGNGLSHGTYGSSASLKLIGEQIRKDIVNSNIES
ncbi:hypothetical protein [Pseudalkalibacillus hwajinpoensis]|uniref:Uracil-DNA glycosylase-like domain-containing protein n=1 Tax=Guptibacillus hwajinpoensis TaxID=208199 RepID=A0A4U1MDL6_9BACL|nr:hypothetical protein [Pseudalkalibacillus hwajinpoensis]TKD69289.1 hypothetical protein FBF83_14915 [Pseudalkalibacillus hwajinpoensis]